MSKRMICSRGTEDQIQATWHKWEWPNNPYLREHYAEWLNSHCEQYWHYLQYTLYFQYEADLHTWRVAHSSEPALNHRIVLDYKNRDLIDECTRWCEQQWGADLVRGNWPHGTWTYGFVSTVGLCMQFAQQEQAAQFALTFT